MQDEVSSDPKVRKSWRWLWHALRTVVLVAFLPVVFTAVAAVLMIGQDIDAPDWLTARIEARASQMMQGGEVAFSNIYITVARDLHPRIRLVDTIVKDAEGRQIARAASLEGGISPRGILFEGSLLMQDVALDGAQISLTRAADGTLAMAFGPEGGFDGAPSFAALLDQSDAFFEHPALAALESVSATGLIVNYTDIRAGRRWTVDGGEIVLDLRDNKTALRGDFNLLSGGTEITRLAFDYESPRGARAAQLGMTLRDARARDIATQSPALQFLAEIDAPITAALRTSLDDTGALGLLSATLELGKGALQPNAATEPLAFDQAKAYMTYDPASQLIRFDHVELEAPQGAMKATGRAYLRDIVAGVPQTLVAQFSVPTASLTAGSLYETGLDLPPATVDLRLRFKPFSVEIGEFALLDGDTHVTASGKIAATNEGWAVAVDGAVDQIAPARLVALWPASVKPGSRNWLAENVSQGQIQNATFHLRARQGVPAVIAARFGVADGAIKFMRTMPLMQDAAGVGYIENNQMILSLDHGHVPAPQGGRVDLTGTSMVIVDTRVKGGDAVVDLALDGSVTSLLSLLDREPFQFITKAGQPVTLADGRATVSGQVRFPLRKGVPPSEVRFDIAAQLRDVRSETLIKGRRLQAARLEVATDNAGLRISGPLQLDGVALNATWEQRFGPQFRGRSQVQAQLTLSEPLLQAFKINLPRGSVTGAGPAEMVIDLVRGAPPAFELTSGLRGVGLALPAVGWRKPAEAGGALLITGTLGAVPQIDRLEVNGGGLTAKGRVVLTDDGQLDAAQFSEVRIGSWLNAPVTVQGRGKGRPVGVRLGSGTVDLRGARFGGGGAQSGPMRLSLDRLRITEGIALTNFSGEFDGQGGFSGEFSGQLNGGPAVIGVIVPQNGRSAIRLQSSDAGGVAAAAGLIKNATSGTLDLTLLPAAGAGEFDGDLRVRNLRVRDAPAMASLLDAISVAGLLRQLDGQGLAFDEVEAKFRLTPREVIVTQASAVGPGLGISLDGTYMLASKQLDFQGVVSPFYILNGIGSIFTRKGEGLIGFNFNLDGPSAAPNVRVNPLSAFTPGMFREIFRRPVPEVSQ